MTALRLRREGWTPPDPLDAEAEQLYRHFLVSDWGAMATTKAAIRVVLERGIEIGKAQR